MESAIYSARRPHGPQRAEGTQLKPAPFKYFSPSSQQECFELLAEHGDDAALLAGGQSLIPLMNLRIARPGVLIDVNRLPELDRVAVEGDRVSLGALVRASDAEHHEGLAEVLPVLREALRHAGHPPIRNRSTLGGSIAHADPASEWPTVIAALDGSVRLASSTGERTLAWNEFLLGTFMNSKQAEEMVVGIELPIPSSMKFRFREVARRHGDFALVGACVGVASANGGIDAARIALFGVGGTPIRATNAEQVLVETGEGDWRGPLREAVYADIEPSSDIHATAAYRSSVAATIVTRMVAGLSEGSMT